MNDIYHKSVWEAIGRVEHFQELFDVDDEDLRLLLDAQYREKEYLGDEDWLEPDDRYWMLTIYGAETDLLQSHDSDLHFSLQLEFDEASTETFLDVIYPSYVNQFEEEYGDTVDELLYFPAEPLKTD